MTSSSAVVSLRQPDALDKDPLTAILRQGARQLLAQAVEAEAEAGSPALRVVCNGIALMFGEGGMLPH